MRTTLQQRLIAGLEALGYQRVTGTRVTRSVPFQRGEGKFWYVGRGGSLRIGHTVATAVPAGTSAREYVLSAPTVRPLVRAWLDQATTSVLNDAQPAVIADKIKRVTPELADVEPRIVTAHVNRWLKERGS